MAKRYIVDLSAEERTRLRELTTRGKIAARKMTRAQILLLADEGMVDTAISAALHVSVPTIEHIRKRFVEEGLDEALNERPRPGAARKLDDKQEAHLIALACSKPPDGQKRWSLRLLADKLVRLEIVAEVSHETVRRTLKRGS
jgi:transposase